MASTQSGMGEGGAPGAPRRAEISGWGRAQRVEARLLGGEDLVSASREATLARGLGRSYGDAALPARPGAALLCTERANRVIAFDPASGVLRAEAGFGYRDLVRAFLPRGWFAPVSPGTQFVTLGGAVAADVHGKNHHRQGSLGRHLRSLLLRTGQGEIVECSRTSQPELFCATLGGLGLTGHVLEVELGLERLPSPWIEQELERCADFESLVAALRRAGERWPFTVAWVDAFARGRALGRGVVARGRWAPAERAPAGAPPALRRPTVPFEMPDFLLNRWSGAAFYQFLYRWQRPGLRIVHPEPYFYPLDTIRHWNRLYGRRGFTQYQCVLPEPGAAEHALHLLELLQRLGAPPFLSVLKDLGAEGEGMLSFPRPGLTLALDIPVDRSRTQALVDRLNEAVIEAGGRIYLAKDAFTRAEHFRAMEPRLAAWQQVRAKWDPQQRLSSALAQRLFGDEA